MASERGEATASSVDHRVGSRATWRDLPRPQRLRVVGCAVYCVFLTLAFIQPLIRLMLHAAQSDLHSHILLVPFITGYLLYIQRGRLLAAYRSSIAGTVTLGGIGFAALAAGIGSPSIWAAATSSTSCNLQRFMASRVSWPWEMCSTVFHLM